MIDADQVLLERRMHGLGIERYRQQVMKARLRGLETSLPPERRLLREAVVRVENALEEWLHGLNTRVTAKQKVRPRRPDAAKVIEELGIPLSAFIACKVTLDKVSIPIKYSPLAFAIGRRVEDEYRFRAIKQQNPAWMEKLLRVTKRSGYSHVRRTALHYTTVSETDFERWSLSYAGHVGTTLLELLVRAGGVVEIQKRTHTGRGRRPKTDKFVVPTADTCSWLEKAHETCEELRPFNMPMIAEPLEWFGLSGGGYHMHESRRPLVKPINSGVLPELSNRDLGEVVPAVNFLQSAQWELNTEVYEIYKHFWDRGIPVGGLPPREDVPYPPRPDDIATNEAARLVWRRAAAESFVKNIAHRSSRIHAAKTSLVAKEFTDRPFYFPYQADFRGRLYPVPYFLQPQGPSESRGLLRFHRSDLVVTGSDAAGWLAVHGANTWGEDKCTFDERKQWVYDHVRDILLVYHDPIENQWWAEADKPWEFLAFCLEWGEMLTEGYVMSKLPVMIDGSNNGLQLFSLLMRDPEGAHSTNVAPTDAPEDIYRDVGHVVDSYLRADLKSEAVLTAADGTTREVAELARKWMLVLTGGVGRDICKRPVMTLPYGVTLYSAQGYVREWWAEQLESGAMQDVWAGSPYFPCSYLTKLIWRAIQTIVKSAVVCMAWLRKVADAFSNRNLAMRWVSPSGFPVIHDYRKTTSRPIRTCIGEKIIKITASRDTQDVSSIEQRNGSAPNFIHSLDAACLVKTALQSKAMGVLDLAVVHDSFGAHATRIGEVRDCIRNVYADVFSVDRLSDLRDQLLKQIPENELPPVPTLGEFDVEQVRSSNYIFS